ncbi:hypothetical protein PLICRDRAFT_177793 [Plicaturopsis crispa FD-325 SS-3]|nr:hypothetical protein PLICRDRAFT_177793 [Plicaturopsis crispa FD-325 SS-3]
MHRCLLISEIICCVCSEFEVLQGNCAGRRALARLAQTCRAFRDPALDILWCILPSFGPLVCTLPADLWEQQEVDADEYGNDREISFLRPMKDSDWTRFRIYARRVRVLDLVESYRWRYTDRLHSSVTSAMRVYALTLPLLPNLQRLSLGDRNPEHLLINIAMLLHPELVSFSLRFPWREDLSERISVLSSLPTACPALTSLTVLNGSPQDKPLVVAAISRDIGIWNRLVQLRVPGLTSPAMGVASALPFLQSLDLERLELADMQDVPKPSFSSLRSLKLVVPSLSIGTAFFSLLPLAQLLRTVEVLTLERLTPSELCRSFFEALGKHSSPLSLKHISVTRAMGLGSIPSDDQVIDVIAILTPLLPFHRLEHLCVNLHSKLAFDDATVRKMAASWPHLRILDLLPTLTRHLRSSHGISAVAFTDLVTSCTELQELSITVDLASASSIVNSGGGASNTNLCILRVGQSRVSDIAGAATFLSAVCPELRYIRAQQDPGKDWEEVTKHVITFASARRKAKLAVEAESGGLTGNTRLP